MKNSITKNYIYNLIYQLIIVIIPVILIPYLARTLTEDGLGTYAFLHSISMWFTIIISFGINLYGVRAISVCVDEVQKSKVFKELFRIKLAIGLIMIGVYISVITIFPNDYRILSILFIIDMISAIIDISWFYMGNENFKALSIRNVIIKLISMLLIFTFVKTINDLAVYILIISSSQFIGQGSLWLNKRLRNTIFLYKLKKKSYKEHIYLMLPLLLSQLISLVYTSINITILGSLSSSQGQTGYYESAQKIVNIVLIITTSLGNVVLPKLSNFFSQGKESEYISLMDNIFKISLYIALPVTFGLMAISDVFVTWFFGENFIPMIDLFGVYSIRIILGTLSSILGTQLLISIGQNKKLLFSLTIGALANITISFVLIPNLEAMGAVIASISAELIILVILIFMTRNYYSLLNKIKLFIGLFLSSIIMSTTVYLFKVNFYILFTDFLSEFLNNNFIIEMIAILVLLGIGLIIYLITNFIIRNDTQKMLINKLLYKVKKV